MNFYTKSAKETVDYIQRIKNTDQKTNKISDAPKKSIISRFFAQFSDFMTAILLVASAISFVVAMLSESGDYLDPVIILLIVIINAVLGVIEETKADKAITALKMLSSPHATILRNNDEMTIPAEEVRIGDILILTAGSRICADARLLKSSALETDEAALTGESVSSEKNADVVLGEFTPLAEQKNMVFSSTNVVHGNGEAIVCAVGMDTEMGKIARLLQNTEDELTPLQKKLDETGKILGTAAIIICIGVFILGLKKHLPPLEMFLTSVSLAVAAIPEGLPIIATIVLAIGVQRMAKHNAIVKNLPAVETLGGATVICSDKTGTLTQNKMTVADIFSDSAKQLFSYAYLCCDSDKNPTEAAILSYADEHKFAPLPTSKIRRISEIPFDSSRKMMSVLISAQDTNRVITKGAPEYVIGKCTQIKKDGALVPLNTAEKRKVLSEIERMSNNALRVIAVAYKDTKDSQISESELILLGLIGMSDPPRDEAYKSVRDCVSAGIKPVMITGDNKITACKIAEAVGIEGRAITGEEMRFATDDALTEYRIFARVTPEDKMRIVKAFKSSGETVAMTGDGVNDAPALKCADIGCSMGKNGTDVAKEASDLILADDNFATIVSAVKEGRGIFENIRKSIKFLLSSNIGEILTVSVGMLLSWDNPLCATQLLWVNLITDSLPALSLGVDPVDHDVMSRPPRGKNEGIFTKSMWTSIVLEGCMIGMLAILAYIIGSFSSYGDVTICRTMAFCVLALSQLFHAFNMRSEGSILSHKLFENRFLVLSLIIGIVLQACVVSVPILASIFKTAPLNLSQWGIVFGLSVMPVCIVELQKLVSKER